MKRKKREEGMGGRKERGAEEDEAKLEEDEKDLGEQKGGKTMLKRM